MKKQFVSVVAIIIAYAAFADVLLWQVPSSNITGTDVYNATQTIGTGDYAWDYAMLRYVDSATAGSLTVDTAGTAGDALDANWENTNLGNQVDSTFGGQGLYSAFQSGGSYYIALYNSAGKLVGYSSPTSSDALSAFKAEGDFVASWEGVNAWGGGSTGWTAAPEPTSGVLLLLGAAVLGLRRRKVA